MLIEQIFELSGPGTLRPYMFSYNWLFSWQNNNLWRKSSSGLLFTAKILQEAMYFTSPTWSKSQNLTQKCKILHVFWT